MYDTVIHLYESVLQIVNLILYYIILYYIILYNSTSSERRKKMQLDDLLQQINGSQDRSIFMELLKKQYDLVKNKKGDQILKILLENSEISLSNLQKEIDLSQYKFKEEISRLEGSLFIEYRKDQDDDRKILVKLSAIGKFVIQNFS